MKDTRLEAIFDAALQKGSPGERAAFLDGACGGRVDLRERVEALLKAHEEAGGFLQATVASQTVEEGPGTVIGRYKLLQRIGEGGFGVVYMAEQLEPVRRKTALKIIKLGMDTKQVVARFESERQALALMDHPHIARVFDAGATDSGRPYFVMELVRGISITEYCDQNNLSTRERLGLFVTVCQAVQHAHQKGIIHRDIKPSNVLVTLHDGKPVPKVIDFGIAKAISQRLTEKTVFTEFRQILGTPQYMSPEQAEMSGLDVDTRCDIYSLGVLLYELLTSTTPLEAERLQAAGYAELQRLIREEDPDVPSLRVSTMHEQLETIARNRRVEPQRLSRLFRGDLDWIVMKALEKDRTRRYAAASDLAADVERYLRDEPVHAGPPGAIYRLSKFARRNRTGVAAALVVAIAIVAGLGLAAAGFIRAHREADRAQAIARFLEEVVAAVDPALGESGQVDVDQVVRRARELFGDDHATVAAALDSLGMQLQHAGQFAKAEKLFRESIRIWKSPEYHDRKLSLAKTQGRLGALLRLTGDEAGAESVLRESLAIAAALPAAAQLSFCDSRTELATLLQRSGRLDEAEALVREALRVRRLHPQSQRYRIGESLELLTQILVSAGRTDEAERTLRETIETFAPLFPPDSPTVAYHNFVYGHWLRQHGRLEKAEPYLKEAVRIYRTMPNPPRELQLVALDGLFQIMRRRDESLDETILLFHEIMHGMAQMLGADHAQLAPQLLGFARILEESNRSADAIPFLVDGLRIARKTKGPEWNAVPTLEALDRHVRRLVLASGLADAKYRTALDGAEALVREQPDNVSLLHLRGMARYRLTNFAEALADLSRAGVSADSKPEHAVQRLAFIALAGRETDDPRLVAGTLDELRSRIAEGTAPLGKETKSLLVEAEAAAPRAEADGAPSEAIEE